MHQLATSRHVRARRYDSRPFARGPPRLGACATPAYHRPPVPELVNQKSPGGGKPRIPPPRSVRSGSLPLQAETAAPTRRAVGAGPVVRPPALAVATRRRNAARGQRPGGARACARPRAARVRRALRQSGAAALSLDGNSPVARTRDTTPAEGVLAEPVLGGLHHRHRRAA